MSERQDGYEVTPFRVVSREVCGVAVASVFGEVDLHTVFRLRDRLREVAKRAGSTGRVVVDLTEARFMESEGLKVLLDESERLRLGGGELSLVLSGAGQVARLFETTRLEEEFVIYEDLALATDSG